MASSGTKLTITRGTYRGNQAEFGGASERDTLTVDFNPTEYAQNASTSYAEAAIPGLQAPLIQFGRGEAQTLSLELLLDTHTYGGDADIRETALRKLDGFLAVDGELHAPPPWRLREGDRLDRVAFDAFGDAALWRAIALANGIEDPLRLEPGRLLRIPALPPGAPRP